MSTRPRNDDLPILEELGRDLEAAFRRGERADAARRTRRRLRRVAAATAALFVVVPGAVATRSIWAPDPGVNTGVAFETSRAVVVTDGRGELLTWRLSAYRDGGGPCWQLVAFDATQRYGRTSTCRGDVDGSPLTLGSVVSPTESVVFGWIAPEVARVAYTTGGGVTKAARIVSAPRDLAGRADVAPGVKAYVATFPGDFASTDLRVVALDASGRELGRFPPKR